MKEIKIDNNSSGKRLDKFLGGYFSECSMGFLFKMLRKKNITLNGKKATGKELLNNGDTISVFFSDDTFYKFANKHVSSDETANNTSEYIKAYERFGKLDIVYEDENILLLNKPVGILSQKAEVKDVSINEWLIGYLLKEEVISPENLGTFRPSVCNRLDRNTSGLLICSKSLAGARKMAEVLKDRSLHKYYKTIVVGRISEDSHLSGYLYKDKKTNKVTLFDKIPDKNAVNSAEYSPIETSFKVLSHGAFSYDGKQQELTELEVLLHTGKTHQIRAHLSSTGHPIIGDGKYGKEAINNSLRNKFGLKFQLLHSYKLVFPKIEGELSYLSDKVFEANLPEQFNNIERSCF